MTDVTPLASGRSADVYGIDELRVLRRYRDGGDATREAAVMRYVAERDFPVPRIFEARDADLVMERVDGPTMLHALTSGELDVDEAAALLADLHHRLHALPPRLSTDPTDRILHLDLHPDNVLLGARGPVVIDWRNATEGPPDLDVALSALILAQVAVDASHDLAAPAGMLLTAFLRCVDATTLSMLDRAVAIRRDDAALSAEEVGRLAPAAALVSSVPRA